MQMVDVYFETGQKRVFAGAIDWPGWCRAGGNEEAALQAMLVYGRRYARVMEDAQINFQIPAAISDFRVVERLPGSSSTDFGAPGSAPSSDAQPCDDAGFQRCQALLQACWRTFDIVTTKAAGKTLQPGPRGGGRDLEKIIVHVWEADAAYLARLAWKFKPDPAADARQEMVRARMAMLLALEAAQRGEIPERSPRGGMLWTPRYFVRRVAWHVLDHLWEIEDRME